MKNILVLTSSRADFGIYLPLLRTLKGSEEFSLELMVFGSHLSHFHGYTINQITEAGFNVDYTISSLLLGDEAVDTASGYALTVEKFATFWQMHQAYDWVIVLGDRFEMAAAVAAGIPFNVPFAHLHGGETTLGAIDNIYRHSISLTSKLHFVAIPAFKKRLSALLDTEQGIHVVGSLSLQNLQHISLLSPIEFLDKWGVDLSLPTILITVHPETVAYELNENHAGELSQSLRVLSEEYQLLITLPNNDTLGSVYRRTFNDLKQELGAKVNIVESLGSQSYFTAMKYAQFLLGNTSSGIIEAASFNKYVLNLGDRQKGRMTSDNIRHVSFKKTEILEAVARIKGKSYSGKNIYFQKDTVKHIMEQL